MSPPAANPTTDLALAPVQPDLVLPRGFDRLGETVQVADLQVALAAQARRDSSFFASSIEGEKREECPVGRSAPPAPPPPDGETGAATLEEELGRLRPDTSASLRQLLAHRGKMSALALAAGRSAMYWSQLRYRFAKNSDRFPAIARALGHSKEVGIGPDDLVECTSCGLHGHLAKDCDRRDRRALIAHLATSRRNEEAA